MAYQVMPNPYGGPPNVRFDDPMDFVDYVDSMGGSADPGSRRQADAIRRNPGAWEMYGGHPREKQNMKFKDFIPAMAIGGAMFGGPALAGLFKGGAAAGAAAGGGVGMNQAIPPAISALGGVGGGTGMIAPAAAGGIGAAINGAAGAAGGGRSLLGRILTGIRDYAPLGLAGASAFQGLMQGRPPAEHQLEGVINTAQGRINQAQPLWDELVAMGGEDAALARSRRGAVDPLFQALTAMASQQMPDAYRRG